MDSSNRRNSATWCRASAATYNKGRLRTPALPKDDGRRSSPGTDSASERRNRRDRSYRSAA